MATGGAATGGAGTGRLIYVAAGYSGMEGDAQTKLVRAIFGDLGEGVTARDIYETTTPTAQCRAVIGEPDTCWVCGYAFTNGKMTEKLGPAQCEHILPIVQAIMYLDLYSPKKLKSLSPQEKANYIQFLKFEYRWAHQHCNLIKKGDVYISYNSVADSYEIKEYGLRMFISNIATFLFKSKFKPSSPQYAKDMEKRKEFISNRVTSIRNNIYMPIVTDLNERWTGIDGKPVVAHGLDQLSAVASLLTAPMTAKGAAATAAAGAATGGYPPFAMLELPKTPADLYKTVLRRVTIGSKHVGAQRMINAITSILETNPFIKDEIIQLYSKIKISAKTKTEIKTMIKAVDKHAVRIAVERIRDTNPSFVADYKFEEIKESEELIIDTLKSISLITTLHAVSDIEPTEIHNMETAISDSDENPAHYVSLGAVMELAEDDLSITEEAATVEKGSLNTSVSSINTSGGGFNVVPNEDVTEITGRLPKSYAQLLAEKAALAEKADKEPLAKRVRIKGPPGYNGSMGGYRNTRKRRIVRRRRTIRR